MIDVRSVKNFGFRNDDFFCKPLFFSGTDTLTEGEEGRI